MSSGEEWIPQKYLQRDTLQRGQLCQRRALCTYCLSRIYKHTSECWPHPCWAIGTMLLQSFIWSTRSTRRLDSKIPRQRKACSVTESIPQGGVGVRSNPICPFYLRGEACGELSLCPEWATGTGRLRSTEVSFSFWHLSFTYLHPHCIFGDHLLRQECVFRKPSTNISWGQ